MTASIKKKYARKNLFPLHVKIQQKLVNEELLVVSLWTASRHWRKNFVLFLITHSYRRHSDMKATYMAWGRTGLTQIMLRTMSIDASKFFYVKLPILLVSSGFVHYLWHSGFRLRGSWPHRRSSSGVVVYCAVAQWCCAWLGACQKLFR